MRILYSLLAIFFISVPMLKANSGTITLSVVNPHLAGIESPYHDFNLQFKINDVSIELDSQTYTIPIAGGDQLDKIERNGIIIYTKFIENQSYVIRLSKSCGYEILPERNARQGVFHYEIINFDKDEKNAFFTEHGQDTKDGIQFSLRCSFTTQRFLILDEYYDPYSIYLDEGSEEDISVLGEAFFNFLHGEKITIQYDVKNERIKIRLDDYLQTGERPSDYVIQVDYVEEN